MSEAVLTRPNPIPALHPDRDHRADGALGLAARERNKARRRIERLEQAIASGELKTIASFKLLELWRHDEDYLDKVLAAECAELKATVRQQDQELARLQRIRTEAAGLEDAIAEREQHLRDLNETIGPLEELEHELAKRGLMGNVDA